MKKPRKPVINPEESELFRAAVSDVVPLTGTARIEHVRLLPQPVPAQRLRDEREALNESLTGQVAWDAGMETGEELSYARNGVGAQTLSKLRRGHWATQDELDLHGLTVEQARLALADFLNRSVHRGLRCVRIIHGKGLRSKNREPVLKPKLGAWLIKRDDILAFCQARSADGGGGAVVVLLRGGKQDRGLRIED
jgi:DNA-nicking Smr family endonuclease